MWREILIFQIWISLFAQVIASWPKVLDAKMAPVWITSAIVTMATEAAAVLLQVVEMKF
jgi:hypothetical protein